MFTTKKSIKKLTGLDIYCEDTLYGIFVMAYIGLLNIDEGTPEHIVRMVNQAISNSIIFKHEASKKEALYEEIEKLKKYEQLINLAKELLK